jgi:hypothetical protein
MTALTCPRCGAPQPEDEPSFTCGACGADLAGGPVDRPDPAGRKGSGAGSRYRFLAWTLAVGLVAVALVQGTVRRLRPAREEPPAAATGPAVPAPSRDLPEPTPPNQLPPARPAGLGGLRVDGAAVPVPGAGTIRGRVTWGRVRPPPVLPFLSSDPACGVTVALPSVPVGAEGGVPEALVVAIPEGVSAAATPRTEPLVATLRACLPTPRLLAGPPETPVELRSVGAARHALEASAPLPGLPAHLEAGRAVRTQLPDSGTVFLTDSAHPWERIALVAVPSSLATTVNAEGFFRLADVPPGKVALRFFTEATGPFDRLVELPPGGDAMVQVDLADEFLR